MLRSGPVPPCALPRAFGFAAWARKSYAVVPAFTLAQISVRYRNRAKWHVGYKYAIFAWLEGQWGYFCRSGKW
jgi:hypothetical protein